MLLRRILTVRQCSFDGFGGKLIAEAGLILDLIGHVFPFHKRPASRGVPPRAWPRRSGRSCSLRNSSLCSSSTLTGVLSTSSSEKS